MSIENSLKRAINQAPLFDPNELWEEACDFKEEDFAFLKKKKTKMISISRYVPTVAAACLVVALTGWFYMYRLPESVVSIDVNPSIELTTNRVEKVLSVSMCNEDGEELIQDLELEKKDVYTAVDLIVDELIEAEYITEQKENMVLVSVSGKKEEKAAKLATRIEEKIDEHLSKQNISTEIVKQSSKIDKNVEEEAKKYGISVGKMQYINQILDEEGTESQLDAGQLAEKSIQELKAVEQTISNQTETIEDGSGNPDNTEGNTEGNTAPNNEKQNPNYQKKETEVNEPNNSLNPTDEPNGYKPQDATGIKETEQEKTQEQSTEKGAKVEEPKQDSLNQQKNPQADKQSGKAQQGMGGQNAKGDSTTGKTNGDANKGSESNTANVNNNNNNTTVPNTEMNKPETNSGTQQKNQPNNQQNNQAPIENAPKQDLDVGQQQNAEEQQEQNKADFNEQNKGKQENPVEQQNGQGSMNTEGQKGDNNQMPNAQGSGEVQSQNPQEGDVPQSSQEQSQGNFPNQEPQRMENAKADNEQGNDKRSGNEEEKEAGKTEETSDDKTEKMSDRDK